MRVLKLPINNKHHFFLAGEGILEAFVDAEIGVAGVVDQASAAVLALMMVGVRRV